MCIICIFSWQGGWNNYPSANQLQVIFCCWCCHVVCFTMRLAMFQPKMGLWPWLLWRCPFCKQLKNNHLNLQRLWLLWHVSYRPTRFGRVVENVLIYIAELVLLILIQSPCEICRASLVRDAAPSSFDENYHLLTHTKKWPCDFITRYCESVENYRKGGLLKQQDRHQTCLQ